jgi:ATP-binding cassette subfamily C protein CydCD
MVVAHRPALVAVADHHIRLPAAPLPVTSDGTIPVPPARPAAQPEEPAPLVGVRRKLWGSALLGAGASASGVALTSTAGWLIVQASTRPPILTLLVAIVAVRAFGLARPALRYVERLQSHDLALRLLAERRVRVYDALVPLTPGALGRRRGELLASVVDDVDAVVDRELRVRLARRSLALVVLLAAIVAGALAPAAGLVVLGTGLVGAAAYTLARHGAGAAQRSSVRLRSELSGVVVETAQLADELAAWQAGPWAAQRVVEASGRLTRCRRRAALWLAFARTLVLAGAGAGVALTALVVAGTVSDPLAALLVLMPWALAEIAAPLADAGALSAHTDAALARLDALDHTAPAVRDTAAYPAGPGSDLVLEDVACRSLTGLDLALREGTRIGVTGASGSGKSTLAALLLRFLDPAHGQLRLDGVPLPLLALDDIRGRVGLIDDDPHVFASTVVENVRLARPDATDGEVADALTAALLGPWVASLPDGLHSWVGAGHAAVSGGERARIALARSLLADQRVLVLDEPTAHLDHGTAEEVAAQVLDRSRGRTVVWITHGRVGLDRVDRLLELPTGPASPVCARTPRGSARHAPAVPRRPHRGAPWRAGGAAGPRRGRRR